MRARFYGLFAASQFLADSAIWSFYLVHYCGLSLTAAVAWNASITAIGGILDIPTGSWADRFGRKRVVMLGFICRALAALIMIIAPTTFGLMCAALLAGFGWAQMSGAAEAFLHDNLKYQGPGNSFKEAMSNVVMVNYASRAIAFVSSGLLYTLHPTLPYAMLCLATGAGAIITFSIPELPFASQEKAPARTHLVEGLRVFLNAPRLLTVTILLFIGTVTAEQLWFSLQPLLVHAGANAIYSGFSYAFGSLGSVLGAYVAKTLFKKNRDNLVLVFAFGAIGVGSILFTLLPSTAGAATAQLVSCIGFGALWTGSSVVLNSHIPSSHRALCLSIVSSLEAACIGLTGCFVGYAFENLGSYVIPTVVALICGALVPSLYFAIRRLHPQGTEPNPN